MDAYGLHFLQIHLWVLGAKGFLVHDPTFVYIRVQEQENELISIVWRPA